MADDAKLQIGLGLDTAEAKAAAVAVVADLKKIETAALQAATVQEAAATKAAGQSRDAMGKFVKAGEEGVKQLAAAQVEAAQKAADAHAAGFAQSTKGAEGFAKSIGDSVSKMALLAGAAKVLGMIAAGYAEIEQRALAAADAAREYEKSSRVGGTLIGLTDPAKMAAARLAFQRQTGLDEKSADDFNRQFEGSLPIGIQKGNITRKTADELKIEAGRMSARQGGDSGSRGDLTGVLAQFGPIRSAREGLGQLETIRQALTEGRGDDAPLTDQLLKVSGSLVKSGGTVNDLSQMAALIGVTSLSAGPMEAGTRAEQLVKGLRGGLVKNKVGQGTEQSQHDYLKSVGIKENDSIETMMDKLVPNLRKQEKAGRNLEVFLGEENFRSSEERKAIIETYQNYDAWKQRSAAARKGADGGAVEAENAKFMSSKEGQAAVADARLQTVKVVQGQKFMDYATAVKRAEEQRVEKEDTSVPAQVWNTFKGIAAGNILSNPNAAGRQIGLEEEAVRNLREKADKMGIGKSVRSKISWGESNAEQGAAYSSAIRAAGGDPFRQFDKLADLLADQNGIMTNILDAINGAGPPPVVLLPPVVIPPTRPVRN